MVETSDELRRRQELQDHGHEMAGLNTGRRSRFGLRGDGDTTTEEGKRKERAYRSALDLLLATDPEYRAVYEELGNRLRDAEARADAQLVTLQAQLAAIQNDLEDMRARSPKIDGLAVFRFADGRVVDENGNELAADIAAGIIWPDDAPTAEAYFAHVEREQDILQSFEDWQGYRNDTLGDIRDRYDDHEAPMSMDDMRDALEEIESVAPPTLAAVAAETPDVEPEQSVSAVPIPDLSN